MNNAPQKLAFKVISLMREQIQQGIDMEGKPYHYSERPFYIPYSQRIVNKLGKGNEGVIYTVIKRGDNLGLIIQSYKAYKQMMAKSMDFLVWTGEMLSALTIKSYSYTFAIVGFNNEEAAKRAFYFNVSGVGKSRKLWKFFGLTAKNQKVVDDYAYQLITPELEGQ